MGRYVKMGRKGPRSVGSIACVSRPNARGAIGTPSTTIPSAARPDRNTSTALPSTSPLRTTARWPSRPRRGRSVSSASIRTPASSMSMSGPHGSGASAFRPGRQLSKRNATNARGLGRKPHHDERERGWRGGAGPGQGRGRGCAKHPRQNPDRHPAADLGFAVHVTCVLENTSVILNGLAHCSGSRSTSIENDRFARRSPEISGP